MLPLSPNMCNLQKKTWEIQQQKLLIFTSNTVKTRV